MPLRGQVISDSDDDDSGADDGLDFFPGASTEAPVEGPAEATISNSTDPSFFRGIYEEQHPATSAPLASSALDLWDVPSSPIAVEWRGTKRKREIRPAGSSRREADGTDGTGGADPVLPLSAAATESTIAYPTPQQYAVHQATPASSVSVDMVDMVDMVDTVEAVALPHKAVVADTAALDSRSEPPSSPDEIAMELLVQNQHTAQQRDTAQEPLGRQAQPKRRASSEDVLQDKGVVIDSTDAESAPAPSKRGRKKKQKQAAAAAAAAADRTTSGKPKRTRGRPKKQVVEVVAAGQPTETATMAAEETRGETQADSPEPVEEGRKKEPGPPAASEPPAPVSVPAPTSAPASAPASAPTKKPVGNVNAGQGRVPYRVGLSKRHRIAPLLKSMPRP